MASYPKNSFFSFWDRYLGSNNKDRKKTPLAPMTSIISKSFPTLFSTIYMTYASIIFNVANVNINLILFVMPMILNGITLF